MECFLFVLALAALGGVGWCCHYKKANGVWPWEPPTPPAAAPPLVPVLWPTAQESNAPPGTAIRPVSPGELRALGQRMVKAMEDAAYDGILPHLGQLQAATDEERILSLMDPGHFRRFAARALAATAGITAQAMHLIVGAHTTAAAPPGLPALQPPPDTPARLERHFAGHLQPLDAALGEYARCFEALCAYRQTACERGWVYGQDYGRAGAEIGQRVGGFWGALAGLGVGLLLGGSTLSDEIDALGGQLDQSFQAMLGTYDSAMRAMWAAAEEVVQQHEEQVERVVRRRLTDGAASL